MKANYLTKLAASLAALALVTGTMLACGGDDDDAADSGTKTGSGGGSSSVGQGGSSTGAGGSAAASSCVTTDDKCGSDTKEANANNSMTSMFGVCYKACCTADNKRGTQFTMTGPFATLFGGGTPGTCLEQEQKGTITADCPKVFEYVQEMARAAGVDAGAITGATGATGGTAGQGGLGQMLNQYNFEGCCRPEGTCGFNVASMQLGCVTLDQLQSAIPLMTTMTGGGTTTTTPAAKTCTYTP
jgi:hypothetical protein